MIRTRSRTLLTLWFLLPTCLLGGCQEKSSSGDDPSALSFGAAPAPGDGNGFAAQTDPNQQQALLQQIWSTLSAPSCWDSSSAGHVAQFQFYGSYEYRHFGFSTFFGPLTLFDVGTYQGYPTLVLSSWTDEIEMIVVTGDSDFVHVFWHDNGTPVPNTYRATAGACL